MQRHERLRRGDRVKLDDGREARVLETYFVTQMVDVEPLEARAARISVPRLSLKLISRPLRKDDYIVPGRAPRDAHDRASVAWLSVRKDGGKVAIEYRVFAAGGVQAGVIPGDAPMGSTPEAIYDGDLVEIDIEQTIRELTPQSVNIGPMVSLALR